MEYLIDVRTPVEFEQGHYYGAVNHELALLEDNLMPEYPKDAEIFVYCRSGGRSEVAKKILELYGFSSVTNIGGYYPELDKEK